MTMDDPMRPGLRPSEAAHAMHETRPALQLGAGRGRARVTLALLTGFCVLLAVGAAILLVVEIADGGRDTSERWGVKFPTWLGMLGGFVVGAAGARHSYVALIATGPRHGILDQVLELGGLRLVHRRVLGRRQTLLVGRNERLTIAASLQSSTKAGTDRSYLFVVTAPAGSFRFTQSVWIERLTLAPLLSNARALGIEVVTTGAATAVAREPAHPQRPGLSAP